MKIWGLSLALLLPLAAGCQTAARPSSGLADLRVRVMAEPKQGVPNPTGRVQVYDAAAHNSSGAFEKVDYSSLDNIVVWVEPVMAPPMAQIVALRSLSVSVPAVGDDSIVAACVGQKLVVTNRSGRAMDIYSVSDGNDFDLGSIAAGGQGAYVIKSGGLIEILTDSSDQPLARVYAAPSCYVAETHSGAEVTFANLPPGDYRISSWHPRLPGSTVAVHLSADQTQSASITVGVNSLPKIYSH